MPHTRERAQYSTGNKPSTLQIHSAHAKQAPLQPHFPVGIFGLHNKEQIGYGTPTARSSVKGQVTDSKGNPIASIRITPVEYRIYRIPDELFIPNEELFTPRSTTLSQSIPTNRDNTKSERNVAVTVPFTWSAKRKISTERRTEAHSLHTGQRQKSRLPIGQGAKAGSTFIKNRPTIG